jgi:hypothetical protein
MIITITVTREIKVKLHSGMLRLEVCFVIGQIPELDSTILEKIITITKKVPVTVEILHLQFFF